MEIAGITKKQKGKLTLTKKGTHFLKTETRQEFFELFISTFADKFNWGFNDYLPEEPIGQRGWTFTIYLLGKFGKGYRKESFYAEKYLKAFPDFLKDFKIDAFGLPKEQFISCYGVRTFERFLEWFGLVEIEREIGKFWNTKENVKATGILTKVFNIDL